jgi:hypothetical protein
MPDVRCRVIRYRNAMSEPRPLFAIRTARRNLTRRANHRHVFIIAMRPARGRPVSNFGRQGPDRLTARVHEFHPVLPRALGRLQPIVILRAGMPGPAVGNSLPAVSFASSAAHARGWRNEPQGQALESGRVPGRSGLRGRPSARRPVACDPSRTSVVIFVCLMIPEISRPLIDTAAHDRATVSRFDVSMTARIKRCGE